MQKSTKNTKGSDKYISHKDTLAGLRVPFPDDAKKKPATKKTGK